METTKSSVEQSRKTKKTTDRVFISHSFIINFSSVYQYYVGHWYINAVDIEVFARDETYSGSYHPT